MEIIILLNSQYHYIANGATLFYLRVGDKNFPKDKFHDKYLFTLSRWCYGLIELLTVNKPFSDEFRFTDGPFGFILRREALNSFEIDLYFGEFKFDMNNLEDCFVKQFKLEKYNAICLIDEVINK